jgi:hypothetical protein
MCQKCSTSHSLLKFDETSERIVYYTCPSKATNNETAGIITHYNGVLGEMNGKNWIWILDLKDFGIKQFLEIGNGIALVKLISEKYSKNLQKIIVINQNSFTTTIYSIVKPLLNEHMQSLILFSNQNIENDEKKNQKNISIFGL